MNLTGRDIAVAPADPVVPGRDPAFVGVYVTDKTATGAVVACDLALAAYAGAAVGLILVPQVEAAIAARQLTPALRRNFHGVVDSFASVFDDDDSSPHLELYRLHAPQEKLPSDVVAWLGHVVRRLDLSIDVAGYGAGRLSVVSIA